MSNTRKTIILVFLISLSLLIVSVYFQSQKRIEKNKKDQAINQESNHIKNALKKIENAKSAYIYKDYEQALNYLEKAREDINKINSDNELFNESKKVLSQIENEEEKIKKAILESENEKNQNTPQMVE